MITNRVSGRNKKHRVLMYAISTCQWCRRAKDLLKEESVEYEYIDVDLCSRDDKKAITDEILDRDGRISYPTLIIDDKNVMSGYKEEEIRRILEI